MFMRTFIIGEHICMRLNVDIWHKRGQRMRVSNTSEIRHGENLTTFTRTALSLTIICERDSYKILHSYAIMFGHIVSIRARVSICGD